MSNVAAHHQSKRRGFAASFGLILLAFAVALFSIGPVTLMTREGAQCPTAPSQSITVPIRSCCGLIVGYEQRAPRAGEAGFVQCRCAEKRAGQNSSAAGPKMEVFLPVESVSSGSGNRLPSTSVRDLYRPSLAANVTRSPFRPPAEA